MITAPGLKRDDMPPAFSPDLQGNPAGTQDSSHQSSRQVQQMTQEGISASTQKESGASTAPVATDGEVASTTGNSTPAEADPYALTQEERDAITKPREEQANYFREWLDKHTQESEADRKKRERQERSRRIIAAVGDGISALSNLYFTSQYAPNAQLHSMSDAVSKRIEQLKAERERDADKYLNYSLRMGDINIAKEKELREAAAQKRAQGLALERAKREAEEHGWLAALQEDKRREQKNKGDYWGYKAQEGKVDAEYAPELAEAKMQEVESRTKKNNRYQPSTRSGGSGKKPEYPWYDKEGNLNYATSYEAMRQNAILNGTWNDATQQSTTQRETKDRKGKVKNTTSSTTVKPAKGNSVKPQTNKENRLGL